MAASAAWARDSRAHKPDQDGNMGHWARVPTDHLNYVQMGQIWAHHVVEIKSCVHQDLSQIWYCKIVLFDGGGKFAMEEIARKLNKLGGVGSARGAP